MIEFLNFSKKYHQVPVLSMEHWVFDKGLYLLKGINGSGKSTLMQSIAARLAFQGDIKINGVGVKRDPRYCREKVSYAAAEPLFPAFLRGRDLLGFFTRTKGAAPWKTGELCAGFGADEFLDNPAGTYSSGMLKKLSLLLAFQGHPDWILLDEPYNGLDIAAQAVLSAFIEALCHSGQAGFIVSSHQNHQDLAVGCQQTVLLENGKLQLV